VRRKYTRELMRDVSGQGRTSDMPLLLAFAVSLRPAPQRVPGCDRRIERNAEVEIRFFKLNDVANTQITKNNRAIMVR
jgi:hypothetical protein